MRHPEFISIYPQSGELIRGHDAWVRIHSNYPGGMPKKLVEVVRGDEKGGVHVTPGIVPGAPILTVFGGGETFTHESRLRYPDGAVECVVMIATLKDGLVVEERVYFASPFDPPQWRRSDVEIIS